MIRKILESADESRFGTNNSFSITVFYMRVRMITNSPYLEKQTSFVYNISTYETKRVPDLVINLFIPKLQTLRFTSYKQN